MVRPVSGQHGKFFELVYISQPSQRTFFYTFHFLFTLMDIAADLMFSLPGKTDDEHSSQLGLCFHMHLFQCQWLTTDFWSHFLEIWTANQWIFLLVTLPFYWIHPPYLGSLHVFRFGYTMVLCLSAPSQSIIERFQDVSRHQELQPNLVW